MKHSINRKIDKQTYSYSGILLSSKKEWTTDTHYNIDGFPKHAKWKRLCMKKYIVDSVYMKF